MRSFGGKVGKLSRGFMDVDDDDGDDDRSMIGDEGVEAGVVVMAGLGDSVKTDGMLVLLEDELDEEGIAVAGVK
jgi:hypothetical protein